MSFLDKLELLKDLTQEERDNLSLFCQEKTVGAGEVLFKEADEGNAMYILGDGAIEISHLVNGHDVVLGTVRAEEILGEMALFGENSTRMATATAKVDSTLITILSFSIKEITAKYPGLLDKIKGIIEERKINNKIIESEIQS